MARGTKAGKRVEALTHEEAKRRNIPTAELQSLVSADEAVPKRVSYSRATPLEPGTERLRDPDLDPQLVWRGKDSQDWSDLVVQAPPIYIQEKVHPKAIIDDLGRRTAAAREAESDAPDLFADFNGLPDHEAKLEFYSHEQNWSNRMILGDSLQVMASLAEKEGLRGQVQCIYIDPPYGIRFNSNWQVSTRAPRVEDGKIDQITREPEQVKAFRDTWSDGVHSYLTYLRDRLTVARDLLTESGSVFVQIGDENVHRVRALMDEVFGADNAISLITYRTTTGLGQNFLDQSSAYIIWYGKTAGIKYRELLVEKTLSDDVGGRYRRVQLSGGQRRPMARSERVSPDQIPTNAQVYRHDNLTSQSGGERSRFKVSFEGCSFTPNRGFWKTNETGMARLAKAQRVAAPTIKSLAYIRFLDDFPASRQNNVWEDTQTGAFTDEKVYVVQTNAKIVQRCLLMSTDPGDLVLDPTCGSGTTAHVAEQWGRRWITIDTSRVALALARARLMGARYPYYLLADSEEGLAKEAELTGRPPAERATHGDIRQGFVYQRVPHITLKSIANNAEIDVIWEKWQETLEPLRARLNESLGRSPAWEEWEIPREAGDDWPAEAKQAHAAWWEARIARQREIDESIARKADQEFLYDKPYEDNSRVRVAGPFTVESLSPHRVIPTDEDAVWEEEVAAAAEYAGRPVPRRPPSPPAKPQEWQEQTDFAEVVLDHLKTSGVHQGDRKDRIAFTSLAPWPGQYVAAEGRFMEGEAERRAAIFIGPEFGTVARPDLIAAAREAAEAGFGLLIACAFNFDAHASELVKLGPVQVIRARMNPDLHMADELKNTGAGNLFVVFGEPDIEIDRLDGDRLQVRILGLDIFDPQKGEVRAGGTDDIAAWFIDTDYDEESFFVRHAYFLGAQDPYKALKTTLKAEIDEEAWSTLYRDTSRPFPRPRNGRIAVKVINHFGDEVMKVFGV